MVRLELILVLAFAMPLVLGEIPSTRSGRGQISASTERDPKTFGLFAVVSFKNEQCVAASESVLSGTCYSSTECTDKGGTADGNCAAGFGVCCMFILSACGGTVSNNCSYFTNVNYPTTVSSASTTCTYTLSADSSICQLRFDFQNFVTTVGSSTTGACGTAGDTVTFTSPSGKEPPVVCGTLTGEHVYMETGGQGSSTLAIATGTGTTSRSWRVKVTQIECTSPNKAPQDCTQYYTGQSGLYKSFNFDGAILLQDQRQAICFRQEAGYCGIDYSADEGTSSPDPFNLFASSASPAGIETTTSTAPAIVCQSRLNIPFSPSGFVCGGMFGHIDGNTDSGTLRVTSPPFMVLLTTRAGQDNVSSTGFKMRWNQVPC